MIYVKEWFSKKFLFGSIVVLLLLCILYLLILISPLLQGLYALIRDIGIPFLISIIIAYLLHPLVNFLVRIGLKRGYAVVFIFLLFFVGVGIFIYLATPVFIKQIREFTEQLPMMYQSIQSYLDSIQDQRKLLPLGLQRGIESGMDRFQKMIEKRMSESVTEIGDGISMLMELSTLIMLVPFIVFYILRDYESFHLKVMKLFPKKKRRRIDQMLREINEGLSNYVSGQLLVSLIVGILVTLGYLLIDFPYPLVFGVISMVFNIIPYLGPFFGAIPAMIIAVTHSWKMVIYVALVNTIAQTIESNFISPYIVGRTTRMHPLSIIIAVLVGGEIAGITGLILAVPVLVMLKVIVLRVTNLVLLNKES